MNCFLFRCALLIKRFKVSSLETHVTFQLALRNCCTIHHVATYCNRVANHSEHVARYIGAVIVIMSYIKMLLRLTRFQQMTKQNEVAIFSPFSPNFSLRDLQRTFERIFIWTSLKASFPFSIILKCLIYLADTGPLLSQVTPSRSERQSSSTHRKSSEREQAEKPVKPAVPGGEPITLTWPG